jgi:small-conductance mechanosensitive channel
VNPAAPRHWYSGYMPLDEPWAAWTVAALVALLAYLCLSVGIRFLSARVQALARRTANGFDDKVAAVFAATSRWVLALAALLVGLTVLELPPLWRERVEHLWFVAAALQVALWANEIITLTLRGYVARHATRGMTQVSASATLMSWAVRTALWTIVLLAALSNFGVDITAFVASLGIGGVAVALALQNILGDLFASLSIAVDKPFEIGDSIAFQAVNGTVEHIGLKTTRIRSITGEQIVISNTDLLKQTISNYKRMQERRVVLRFGLTYDTTTAQARKVPEIVKRIVKGCDKLRFERVHLQNLGASSLDYELVYYVQDPSYELHMDRQQEIMLKLMDELAHLGAELAFPTRTVRLLRPDRPKSRPPGRHGRRAVADTVG